MSGRLISGWGHRKELQHKEFNLNQSEKNSARYVTDFKTPFSPKHKSPWVTVNQKDVSDSQMALEFLEKELNVDTNAHLSKREVSPNVRNRQIIFGSFFLQNVFQHVPARSATELVTKCF
jgi:hypothetical protein